MPAVQGPGSGPCFCSHSHHCVKRPPQYLTAGDIIKLTEEVEEMEMPSTSPVREEQNGHGRWLLTMTLWC